MIAGWLFVPGSMGVCWFLLVGIFFLGTGSNFSKDVTEYLRNAFFISLLIIPGVLVEHRRRQVLRAKAQQAAVVAEAPLVPPAVEETKQI
jgi:hypothetical protein